MSAPELLWTPSRERVERSGFTRFTAWLEKGRGLRFESYEALWRWSVTELEAFWGSLWDFGGVIAHQPYDQILERRTMPGARWFPGATLNYAEHSLRPENCAREEPALVFVSETRPRSEISWPTLAAQVAALAGELKRRGVGPGDRVASYMPNIPEAVAALLAAASLGAIWSSCSPDMGPVGVLDRFRQIEPKVLFAVDGYRYGGKAHDRRATVRELVDHLPSLQAVIFCPYLDPAASLETRVPVVPFAEAIAQPAPLEFAALPFDHPLWIVYSSGTTGMPKPIVHGHGGTILENLKATLLHLDVSERDRFFWFSSTSWIMWNLWVSTLATGCTALQFDGNPGHPDAGELWRFAARERATFFGVSPAFLSMSIKAGVRPREAFDLSSLRTVGSTGSPLTADTCRWVYREVNPDVLLASISGGTDPGAAFLTSCPVLPVYAGEMQCRGLGCSVHAFDEQGREVIDEVGELVVTEPMPSMPLFFWGDEGGKRYTESYFETWPGVWRHGDWLRLVPREKSMNAVIYGRSDSTINRHGIRMGTSELYRVVEELPEIIDSLAIDLEYLGRPSFLALFVVLRSGPGKHPAEPRAAAQAVPGELRERLLKELRSKLSGRHVPDEVFAIAEVPRTLSGKKLEVPVKKILLGHPVEKSVNRDAMANPAAIDWFVAFAKARSD